MYKINLHSSDVLLLIKQRRVPLCYTFSRNGFEFLPSERSRDPSSAMWTRN